MPVLQAWTGVRDDQHTKTFFVRKKMCLGESLWFIVP